jgi:hypothetical protein
MKKKFLWLVLLTLGPVACDREESDIPAISLVGSSACKNHGLKTANDQSSDQDCIRYSWVTGDSLIIKHVNAGFNCCPEGFRVELKVAGDTLIISENENSNMCDCSCLFDLDYKLSGIGKDTWYIRIEEPYARQPGDKKILFKAELKMDSEGEFCVTRTGYPWGT